MKKIFKTIIAFFSAIAMVGCSQVQGGRMDRRKIVKASDSEEIADTTIKCSTMKDSTSTVTLTFLGYFDGDKEYNDTVSVNSRIEIPAKANPTTGFDWEVKVETEDSTILKLEDVLNTTPARDPSQPMMCGAPSSRLYVFKTVKTGSAKIIFEYKRPWGNSRPETTVVYNITITE